MPPPSQSAPAAAARWSRRQWLRVGGLGSLGLSLPDLWRGTARAAGSPRTQPRPGSFGRAKSCVILFLTGGPPQHETFDPKPDAPLEIRGDFRAIRTRVPGMQFSELLPHTAGIADKLAVIRSMTTDIQSHATSGYWMLTGYEPTSKAESVPPNAADWPSLAATVGALKPSTRSPFSSVILPEPLFNNPHILWPGQNGGLMGPTWNPHVLECDPSAERIRIEGIDLVHGVSPDRLTDRAGLLTRLDRNFAAVAGHPSVVDVDRMQAKAFDLLRSTASRDAFALDRESGALRDRYGRHKFGQSTLLARRLIEAGARLVQVNWPREPGDTTAGNPVWDTHQKNSQRARDVLCPQFDRTFATFITDLHDRGLLDETLVVVMGEFGRSPKINVEGGRDHWGTVFSVALAGAGIGGGQIIGSSDRLGAMPDSRPVRPPDLAATIFHLLGIDPNAEFLDPLGRPRRVTDDGTALRELVGA